MQVSFLGTKMQVSKADMMCLLVLSRQQRQALTLAFPRSPACQVTGLSPAFPTRHSSQQIFAKKCQKKVDTLVVSLPVGELLYVHVVMARRSGSCWAGGAWKGAGRQQEGNQYESCGSPAAPPEGRTCCTSSGPGGWSRLPHLDGVGSVPGGEYSGKPS